MAVTITKAERNEALRLESLKIAIALYGGKSGVTGKFLGFAAEVYEFIKGDEEEKETVGAKEE